MHILAQEKNTKSLIFNVGGENLSLDQIAFKVREQINPDLFIEHSETNDLRSYRVDSSRILNELGFKPIYSVDQAIKDLKDGFMQNIYKNSIENPLYFNIKRMKDLNLA